MILSLVSQGSLLHLEVYKFRRFLSLSLSKFLSLFNEIPFPFIIVSFHPDPPHGGWLISLRYLSHLTFGGSAKWTTSCLDTVQVSFNHYCDWHSGWWAFNANMMGSSLESFPFSLLPYRPLLPLSEIGRAHVWTPVTS